MKNRYIESELVHVFPFSLTEENYKTISIQLNAWNVRNGDSNRTKWMNITVEQAKAIERILLPD